MASGTAQPLMYLDVSGALCSSSIGHSSTPTATVAVGSDYYVGICIENQPAAPHAFEATINLSGPTLIDSSTELTDPSPSLADNPNANDGSGSTTIGPTAYWSCTGVTGVYPAVNNGQGQTHIVCNDTQFGPNSTLTTSPGLLATIKYHAAASGTLSLRFTTDGSSSFVYGSSTVNCDATPNCFGADVNQTSTAPTPTVTATPTSTATATATATPPASRPSLQSFDIDAVECVKPAATAVYAGNPTVDLSNVPNTRTQQCSSEVTATNTPVSLDFGLATGIGARQSLPFVYAGPGWQRLTPAEGATAGGTHTFTDVLCDQNSAGTSNVDILADSTGAANDEPFVMRTTQWNATSGTTSGGIVPRDESYLSTLLPANSIMIPNSRYRADVNTFYLGGTTTYPLTNAVPLQVVGLKPSWMPGNGSTTVTLLGGAPSAPSTQLQCVDSPRSSFTHFDGVAKTPMLAGRYPVWITEISDPDLSNNLITFSLFVDCKTIDSPAGTDADSDCLSSQVQGVDLDGNASTTAASCLPVVSTCPTGAEMAVPADTNDAIADIDSDGLPDGVEVAWGTSPTSADTDGDGRTDLEEMAGPVQDLSNPTVADTDSDGVPDGGFILDANFDGTPDARDNNGDGTAGDNGCQSMSSGDHLRCGFDVVRDSGTGLVVRGDNCSGIANPTQQNTDEVRAGGDAFGDACDLDDDADGIPDQSEMNFVYQRRTSPSTSLNTSQCRADGDSNDANSATGTWTSNAVGADADSTNYAVTPLNPLSPDTDGDGFLDGAECQASAGLGAADGGANPKDNTSKPRVATVGDLDSDGLGSLGAQRDQEQTARTVNFSGTVSEDVDGDGTDGISDCDSDGDVIPDGIEYLVLGTSPINPDSDNDGVADGVEFPQYRKGGCSGMLDNGSGINANDTSDPSLKSQLTSNPQGIWTITYAGADADGDGLTDWGSTESCTNGLGTFATLINMDNTDLLSVAGDPTSKDSDRDGVIDGAECALGTNPILKSSKPTTAACGGTTDTDGDGLSASAERCKWGTLDTVNDSDGDTIKDCVEANDNNGDNVQNFPGDTINSAKAANNIIQKTGDFDLNGDGAVNFPGDTITSAKMANHANGICP